MNCRRIFSLLLLLCLGSPALHAEKEFQILYFQKPASAPEELQLYVNGAVGERIELPNNRFSETYTLKAEGDLLLTFTDKTYEDPEKLKPFPTAKVATGWKKFIILGFNDPSNKGFPVRFVTMNVSTSDFGVGDFRFINFSDAGFAGKLGSKDFKIQPKGTVTYGDFAEHNKDFRMKVSAFRPDENNKLRKKPFVNKLLRYNENIRAIFFIYSPEGSSRMTYHAAEIRGL